MHGDVELFEGLVPRRRDVIGRTLAERDDPRGMFCAELTVELLTTTEGS